MRDHRQKGAAHKAHLLERGFTLEECGMHIRWTDPKRFERFRELSSAFDCGWDEAQKWEVGEAERDALAAQAMIGLLAAGNLMEIEASNLAKTAYLIADAMIKARKV